jgi:hypothetical protein
LELEGTFALAGAAGGICLSGLVDRLLNVFHMPSHCNKCPVGQRIERRALKSCVHLPKMPVQI